MEQNNYGVFISYRRRVMKQFASRVYDMLEKYGLVPFMDIYNMKHGNFIEHIKLHILQSI